MYILDFFDEYKHCDESLIELKKQYLTELASLSSCKHCKLLQIREKYLNLLITKYFSSTAQT